MKNNALNLDKKNSEIHNDCMILVLPLISLQELEYKVYEMENQLQMREALKAQQKLAQPLPPLEDNRHVNIYKTIARVY